MDSNLIKARDAFLKHEFSKSLNFYQQEMIADPKNLEALLGAAKCYAMMKNYTEAVSLCKRIIDLNPNFTMAHVVLSEIYYQTGESSKSRYEIELAYSISPADPNVLESYGVLLFQDKNWDRGIEILEEALRLDPKMYHAYFNLSIMYEKKQDIDKVLWCAQKIYELNPSIKNKIRLLIAQMNYKRLFKPIVIGILLFLFVIMAVRIWELFIPILIVLIIMLFLKISLQTP